MININAGYSKEIFGKCRILEEYSIFIQKVREYNEIVKDLAKAVHLAVEECIRNNILKELLETQKKEVIDVVLTEFDEEKFEAMIREEEREEGRKEGHIEGRKEGRKEVLWENVTALFEYGMGAEDVSAALKIGLESVKERYEVWNKKRNVEVPA